MGILDELRQSANLKVYHDGRRRSMLDYSGNGLTLTPSGTGHRFIKTAKGAALTTAVANSSFDAGVAASLDLTTATMFYNVQMLTSGAVYLVSKYDFATNVKGYVSYWSSGPTITLILNAASAPQTIAITNAAFALGNIFQVVHTWNGTNVITYANGVQIDVRAQTVIPSSVGNTYRVARPFNTPQYGLISSGMANIVLAGSEVARLYDDFLTEGPSPDLIRKNFVQVPKGLTDTEYTAQGICLDTDFVRGPDGKIRDNGPNNYAGTVTGVVVPGVDGLGSRFPGGSSSVNFGDVTQLNSATKFTISGWIDFPPTTLTFADALWTKYLNNNNQIGLTFPNGSAATQPLQCVVANGALTYGLTAVSAVRAGTTQFVAVSYDGTGATDADKLKIVVGAENRALTFPGGNIPASVANLVGRNFIAPVPFTDGAIKNMRVRTGVALSLAQIQAEYLATGAQKVLLRETFEDVPVSLGVSATAGMYIGQWRVIAGSAQCTETADGNRYLTTIAAASSGLAIPSKQAFGTWRFRFKTTQNQQECTINFIANVEGNYGAAGQGSYAFYCVGQFYLLRGGAIAFLATVPAGVVVPQNNTEYDVVITRRPSDCQFKMYIKGGTLAQWTLVATVADSTYLTSNWFNVFSTTVLNTCSLNMSPQYGVTMYQGVLDPTAGEIF